MRVEALAVHLRPRSMAEAADLGIVLVHQHARSIAGTWLPVFLAVVAVALATVEIAGWLPTLLIFWAKPWLDRTLLFTLSRAVFDEPTRFADLWRHRRAVWGTELLSTLTVRRLSPWRSYTQAIGQLEGQRGKARRARRSQMLAGKRGAASGMHIVYAHVEVVLCVALAALALWFAPAGSRQSVFDWMLSSGSIAHELAFAIIYAAVVMVLEPFYVAAGFAMYLNRRVELEAWDIEQEFRHAFG
ncbi:MAG TPA: hypothetical protein VIL30_05060 [Ramlibacter sp.]|jgi:hypothetical protein